MKSLIGELIGELAFYYPVEYVQGDDRRSKSARLTTVHCYYQECEEKVAEFKTLNPRLDPEQIKAKFTLTRHFF